MRASVYSEFGFQLFRDINKVAVMLIAFIFLVQGTLLYPRFPSYAVWLFIGAAVCLPIHFILRSRLPYIAFITSVLTMMTMVILNAAHASLRFGANENFHLLIFGLLPFVTFGSKLGFASKWIVTLLMVAVTVLIDSLSSDINGNLILGDTLATTLRNFNIFAVAFSIIWTSMHYYRLLVQEHEQLEIMAGTDALTTLMNRRRLKELATQSIELSRRYSAPISLAICDLDHFKKINDTYGHDAGDEVLRYVSQVLTTESRHVDCIGRWGGEEFMLVFPHTDKAHAMLIAERIRQRVADAKIPHEDKFIQISLTIGVATFSEEDSFKTASLRADSALYAGKAGGRNCVVFGEY